MNLPIFLSSVQKLTGRASAQQLSAFILGQAMDLPEEDREDFLAALRDALEQETGQGPDTLSASERPEDPAFARELQGSLGDLSDIEEGIYAIEIEPNDERTWDDPHEYVYLDPDNSAQLVENAAWLVHQCVDRACYARGLELGRKLLFLRVPSTGACGDDTLYLSDLQDEEVIVTDLDTLLLDTLTCALWGMPVPDLPDTLYRLLERAEREDASLRKLLDYSGRTLDDLPGFLEAWIRYLEQQGDLLSNTLILEAVGMARDVEQACTFARECPSHPQVWLRVMDVFSSLPPAKLLQIGREAVNTLPEESDERARAALWTARYLLAAGDPDPAERKGYYLTACEAEVNGVNYLRAILNTDDLQQTRARLSAQVSSIPTELPRIGDPGPWRGGMYSSWQRLYALHFLDGQFDLILSAIYDHQDELPWNASFARAGCALFFLYLYAGDLSQAADLPAGLSRMLRTAEDVLSFTESDYLEGLPGQHTLTSDERHALFLQVFSRWRELTPMSYALQVVAPQKLWLVVERHTQEVLSEKSRYDYPECAALIAAQGEVRESLGEEDAKQKLLQSYHNRFPRFKLFNEALRDYGWKKSR